MPAGASAEGKARYRQDLQRKLLEAEAHEKLVHPETLIHNDAKVTGGTVADKLKARRQAYNDSGKRDFEALAGYYEHGADFEGRIQQFQCTSMVILTMQIPAAYADDLLRIQRQPGSMWFRVYIPEIPKFISELPDPPSPADLIDVQEVKEVSDADAE